MKKMILIGNITADAQSRIVGADNQIITFDIAINEKKGDRTSVTYITINWWSKNQNVLQYLKKGTKVAVDGNLDIQKWTKDGVEKMKVCCTAQTVNIVSWAKPVEGQAQTSANQGRTRHDFSAPFTTDPNDDLPF